MVETITNTQAPGATAAGPKPTERLVSLDAYRGFIMLVLASAGLGIPRVAERFESGFWPAAASQLQHSAWVGCTPWDLIQPAFMFMVGVAIPYSYAKRQQQGHSFGLLLRHALTRGLVLVLLGVFLASAGARRTDFVFTNVLAQIGLGYVFVVLLRGRGVWLQAAAVLAILAGYWYLFYQYPSPQPGPDFDYAAYGLPPDWPLLSGVPGHWNKHANFAARFDLWFLNLFPREKPYALKPGDGGYPTLNFIPSMATMILGLMAGELLRSARSAKTKLVLLVLTGVVLMVGALIAGGTVCPIVKRIWTPSWALLSGAYVVWMLAAFYALVDLAGYRRWAFPLAVVGMNSIVIYLMGQLMKGWTWSMLKIHLGPLLTWGPIDRAIRAIFGPAGFNPIYVPIVQSASVLLVFWLICWWLYRQKIFVRI
jgi:predicted acyltransferase